MNITKRSTLIAVLILSLGGAFGACATVAVERVYLMKGWVVLSEGAFFSGPVCRDSADRTRTKFFGQ